MWSNCYQRFEEVNLVDKGHFRSELPKDLLLIAQYIENLEDLNGLIEIFNPEDLHHLQRVLRVKKGEEVLLLNGKGLLVTSKIQEVTKDKIVFQEEQRRFSPTRSSRKVAVCISKKKVFEETIELSCQLGIGELLFIQSDFSLRNFPTQLFRIEKILKNSIQQSRSPYLPKIKTSIIKLENFVETQPFICCLEKTQGSEESSLPAISYSKGHILIGPEGGFSQREITLLTKSKLGNILHFEVPIMRVNTALIYATGYIDAQKKGSV